MLQRLVSYIFGEKPVAYNEADYQQNLFPENSVELEEDEELLTEDKIASMKCEHRIGIVTKLEPHGMIDGKFYFDVADLKQKNIKVGQSVRYVAYRLDENREWTIRNITLNQREEWEHEVSEIAFSKVTKEIGVVRKTLTGKVIGRRGRIITMSPNDIQCDLDRVQSEFLPVEGDWIQFTAIVELNDDNLNEIIVDIEILKPLRSRTYEGKVSDLSENGHAGIVNNAIFFTSNVCDGGHMPGMDDKVVVRAIESNQGTLIWRAVHLIILESSSEYTSLLAKIQEERLFDSKMGVLVTVECDKKSLKIGEQTTFKLKVENAGDQEQTLTSVVLKNSNTTGVMRLLTEFFVPIVIESGCYDELEVLATARSSGHYSEITMLHFKGDWQIGCLLDIYVHIEEEYQNLVTNQSTSVTSSNNDQSANNFSSTSEGPGYQRKNNKFQIQRLSRREIVRTWPTQNGFLLVPGVRPNKVSSFKPKSLLQFPIPEWLRNIVLGDGIIDKSNSAIAAELEDMCPYLTEQLRDVIYLQKFHTLLHLEDLELSVAIKKFDKDRADFTHQGEYLVLEIPNLAESRPSLVVGDKLIASELKISEKDGVKYEGYIHKVTSHSIKLKFSPTFHSQYDGKSMHITFIHSRTAIMRAHQALNEVFNHLGKVWLFPNSLGTLKQDQVNIVGEYPSTNISDQEHVCNSDIPEVRPNVCDSSNQSVVQSNGKSCSQSLVQSNGKSSSQSLVRSSVKSASKSRSIKSRKFARSQKTRANLSMILRDTDSEESDNAGNVDELVKKPVENVDKCTVEPVVDDVKLSEHSYASLRRPMAADRPISWEQESRAQRGASLNANGDTPPIKPAKSSNIQCRDVIVKWVNPTLNKYQRAAVRNILKGEARPLPYIIHGPPGTGKTITIVETILQIMFLLPESRILVATPSNSSADLLCERLLSWRILKPGDLVRLVGYNYMVENRMAPFLKPYCTCMDTKSLDKNAQVNEDNDGVKYSSREVVGRHRITVGTCVSLGVLYTMGFPKNHFTHIIIDEAGQSTEPEIMIPLAFLNANDGQAILAGDPLQLGPVVTSNLAKHMGLGDSLLDRFYTRFPYHCDPQGYPETHGYDPRLVTRLLFNYRSLPDVLELYSSLFYDSKLIPKVCPNCSKESVLFEKIREKLKIDAWQKNVGPVIFHGVKGTDMQDEDSPSWYNDHETVRVISYLSTLYNEGLKNDDIGIVTPYQKQVMKIREMIKILTLDMPKVGTVEEFQGQERKVIIISTVRSNEGLIDRDLRHSLGFVSSQQRLNVAISRARMLLIIVGNPHILGRDQKWKNLIKLCKKRQYYIGCDLPSWLVD